MIRHILILAAFAILAGCQYTIDAYGPGWRFHTDGVFIAVPNTWHAINNPATQPAEMKP